MKYSQSVFFHLQQQKSKLCDKEEDFSILLLLEAQT